MYVLGFVTSICLPVFHGNKFKGVTCIDLVLEDIIVDIKFLKSGEPSYIFMIDDSGRTVYHPRLPEGLQRPVHISTLEPEADSVITEMMK